MIICLSKQILSKRLNIIIGDKINKINSQFKPYWYLKTEMIFIL